MLRFDTKYGTETAGYIGWEDLRKIEIVNQDKGHGYQGASKGALERSLKSLAINYEEYVFLDFGSGKGWGLLLASHFPFKKIIGIELFEMLHRVAEKNVTGYKGSKRKCYNIDCFCMNVLEFELPKYPLVCFLFNPFQKDMIRQLLEKISTSVLESPRPVMIIYQNPRFISIFDECQLLIRRKMVKIPFIGQLNYAIYSSK